MEQTEAEFLASYDPGKYPRPSVTADIVLFTVGPHGHLMVLLIRRGGHPFKDRWALPGGFVSAGKESVDQAAARELAEETGIQNAYLKQLYTFSDPGRDPRTHVISVAYTALIPYSRLKFAARDDAADAKLFRAIVNDGLLYLNHNDRIMFRGIDLGFDHNDIILTAIKRLQGRISYEPDAFELLEDKGRFTLYELQQIFEAIQDTELDTSNFRKMVRRNYVETGFIAETGERGKRNGYRPAALFCCTGQKGN